MELKQGVVYGAAAAGALVATALAVNIGFVCAAANITVPYSEAAASGLPKPMLVEGLREALPDIIVKQAKSMQAICQRNPQAAENMGADCDKVRAVIERRKLAEAQKSRAGLHPAYRFMTAPPLVG